MALQGTGSAVNGWTRPLYLTNANYPITLAAWVKLPAATTTSAGLFGLAGSGTAMAFTLFYGSDIGGPNGFVFDLYDNVGVESAGATPSPKSGTFTSDGNWHHIAAQITTNTTPPPTGQGGYFWLDGVRVGDTSAGLGIGAQTFVALQIGVAPANGTEPVFSTGASLAELCVFTGGVAPETMDPIMRSLALGVNPLRLTDQQKLKAYYPLRNNFQDLVGQRTGFSSLGTPVSPIWVSHPTVDAVPVYRRLRTQSTITRADTAVASETLTGGFGWRVSLSDTTATSESLVPNSGVTGYLATINDAITTNANVFSADFSADFGSGGITSSFSNEFSTEFGNGPLTDVLTASLGIVQSLSDTVATASSQFVTTYNVTVPSETAASSDSLTVGPRIIVASLTDTIVATDARSNITAIILTDTLNATDILSASRNATAGLNDSVLSSDVIGALQHPFSSAFSADFDSVSGGSAATLSDTLAINDILTFNAILTLADTIATTDSLTGASAGITVTLADTAATNAVPLSAVAAAVTLSDSSATNDTVTRTGTGTSLSDTLSSSDTLSGLSGTTATLGETTATSDSLQLAGTGRLIIETTASSDSLTLISGYATGWSANAATADALNVTFVVFSANVAENTTTSDVLTASSPVLTTLTDSTTTSDAVSINGHGLPLADTISGTDITSVTGVGAKTISDSAAAGEALNFVSGYIASLSDSVATSETRLPIFTIAPAALAESAAGSETLTGARPVSAAFADSLNFTEAYNLVTYIGTLSDSAATLDGLSAVTVSALAIADIQSVTDFYASQTLLDAVAVSDIAISQGAGFGSFIDAALSGDILLPIRGFQFSLTDSAAINDAPAFNNFGYSFAVTDTTVAGDNWISDGIGSPLLIEASVIPTGGAVLLQFPGYFPVLPNATHLTIRRSIDGSGVWSVIYDGPPVGVFLDIGDGSPKPLDAHTAYLWQAEDYSGTTQIGPLTPSSTFLNQPDQLTQILIRALQGALNSMTLPAGYQRPLITIRMPANGWQAMPFIVVNLDLIQQTDVEIGEDVINPTQDNNWTLFANAKRVWRVTIMSQDAEERDFYRDTLLAVFRVLKATAFAPIGLDVSHTFQAVSYSSAQEWEGVAPGFYAADLMLEVNGIFSAAVLTNYPTILRIEADPTYKAYNFVVDLEPTAN